MAKRTTRKYTKKQKELGLFGVPVETTNKVKDTTVETMLTVASAFGGSIAGAAIGRPSFWVGLPIIVIGVAIRNKYVALGGAGMCLANGFQPKVDTQTSGIDDEVDGFDMEQVKNRVGNYFKSFSEKLYLSKPKEDTTTYGLGETPTYFINPYNTQIEGTGEVDMSQLDRVQQEIANMGGTSGTGNMGNPDRIL